MIRVRATREGLPGEPTASGYVIESDVPFVALPSKAALRLWVMVHNPLTGKRVRALVLDVGPWNTRDHRYVFQPLTIGWREPEHDEVAIRPQAESGIDTRGRTTNHAGIDLGARVWLELGMMDNTEVEWEFV